MIINPKETTMEDSYRDTENMVECALFYKVEIMHTKYSRFGVSQRLSEIGLCYEFVIETGDINISSYKTLKEV